MRQRREMAVSYVQHVFCFCFFSSLFSFASPLLSFLLFSSFLFSSLLFAFIHTSKAGTARRCSCCAAPSHSQQTRRPQSGSTLRTFTREGRICLRDARFSLFSALFFSSLLFAFLLFSFSLPLFSLPFSSLLFTRASLAASPLVPSATPRASPQMSAAESPALCVRPNREEISTSFSLSFSYSLTVAFGLVRNFGNSERTKLNFALALLVDCASICFCHRLLSKEGENIFHESRIVYLFFRFTSPLCLVRHVRDAKWFAHRHY